MADLQEAVGIKQAPIYLQEVVGDAERHDGDEEGRHSVRDRDHRRQQLRTPAEDRDDGEADLGVNHGHVRAVNTEPHSIHMYKTRNHSHVCTVNTEPHSIYIQQTKNFIHRTSDPGVSGSSGGDQRSGDGDRDDCEADLGVNHGHVSTLNKESEREFIQIADVSGS